MPMKMTPRGWTATTALLVIVLTMLLAVNSWATIAFDASSETTGTTSLSWTHTPVGTPRGVFVGVSATVDLSDVVSACTYGPVSMSRVAIATRDGFEDGTVYAFFLGSSIPTGEIGRASCRERV